MMTIKSGARLVLCLLLCLAVGIVGSIVTKPQIAGWYAALAKPFWTPPPFVFPIAWTTLYVLMAISLWRLWSAAPSAVRSKAIGLFAVQLALNAVWSPVFFGWHGIRSGLVIIVLLAAAIAATIIASARVDRLAAWLLVPYLLWVIYAGLINAGVVVLN